MAKRKRESLWVRLKRLAILARRDDSKDEANDVRWEYFYNYPRAEARLVHHDSGIVVRRAWSQNDPARLRSDMEDKMLRELRERLTSGE